MKRLAKAAALLVSAALLFGTCPVFALESREADMQEIYEEETLPGDMNGDGGVDITDVMAGCRVLARKNTGIDPAPEELRRGDVTGDESFDIADIMGICRIIAAGGQSAEQAARTRILLNDGWKFKKSAVEEGMSTALEDEDWESVSVPHSYNNLDGQDGPSTGYYRGDAWYRKWIRYSQKYDGKKVWLNFEGTAQSSQVYLNGELVGEHMGGFTAYRFDVTDRLQTGANLLAVKVNNQKNPQLAPQGGDFTIQGGMYRDVYLTVTDDLHVDMLDSGSEGLYLSTPSVSKEEAVLDIRSRIVNDADETRTVTVSAELCNPEPDSIDWIDTIPEEWLPFDTADMAPGGSLETVEETFTIQPGEAVDFQKEITLRRPHLWDGLEDPYRYLVKLRVREGTELVDAVEDYVGFRSFTIDYDTGFYLNGRSYPLRGVNAHQDWQDLGYALTKENFDTNMGLIYEIGANTVRLAHYPHCDYTYSLCDQYGIMVWAEAPFVGGIGGSGATWDTLDDNRQAFFATTRQQLRELILQQYNRPSIFCWSMYNEIDTADSQFEVMRTYSAQLSDMIHEMDPYRYSTFAAHMPQTNKWEADLVGWNIYPGWYTRNMQAYGETIEEHYNAEKENRRPLGLSEYGAGSNIAYHADWPYPVPAINTYDAYQTEEYQALVHEYAIMAINERPYLWGTYVWNMFDFAVDSRNEGGIAGRNNKGLVTYDRQVKKDAFYLYKANWSSIPFVEIGSKRYNPRLAASIMLKVYSNCESVELFVDGVSQGVQYQSDLTCPGVFNWEDVALKLGDTEVRVVAAQDGETFTDEVVWTRAEESDNVDIYSASLKYDNDQRTVALNRTDATVEEFLGLVNSKYNAALTVLDEAGNPVETGPVGDGYRLQVVSEDGSRTALYKILGSNLCWSAGVKLETDGYGERNRPEYMVDGDTSTRWQANTYKNEAGESTWRYPETVTVDLGRVYDLRHIMIDWYNPGSRVYAYTLESSLDGEHWVEVADKTNNKTAGTTSDSLDGVTARYIRIRVTGNSNAASNRLAVASIYEIYVYGLPNDQPSSNAELLSDTLLVNADMQTVELPAEDTTASQLLEQVCNAFGASLAVVDGDGQPAAGDAPALGCRVEVTAADGAHTQYYRILGPSLTGNARITTSSWNQGEGHETAHLADRDASTRWAANPVGGKWNYPEWVLLDLGDTYELDHIIIDWFTTDQNNRVYDYTIEISQDGQDFAPAVDRTSNTEVGEITDLLTGEKARYLRITVTGCNHQEINNLAIASIWDIYLYGVRAAAAPSSDTALTSSVFAIDPAEKALKLSAAGITAGQLLAGLAAPAGAAVTVVDGTDAAVESSRPVDETLRVKVTAADGVATAYYVIRLDGVLSDNTDIQSDAFTVDNEAKTVKILADDLTAEALLAGVSSAHNASFSLVTEAGDPAPAGALTDGLRLRVTAEDKTATADYRLLLPRPVFAQTVTATSAVGHMPVYFMDDGKANTRWGANNDDDKWKTEVLLDLGEVYDLTSLQIDWYTSGGRAYTYLVEVSEDGQSYRTAIDRSRNTQAGSVKDGLEGAAGRYVKIRATGCSDMDTNTAAVPSIYEFHLRGIPRTPCGGTDLYAAGEAHLLIDNQNGLVGLPADMTDGELLENLAGRQGGKITLLDGRGQPLTGTDGAAAALLRVTAEDGRTTRDYRLSRQIALSDANVSVTSNANQDAKNKKANLVDGDPTTRWNGASGDKWTGVVVLDLGKSCSLDGIQIDWYNGDTRDTTRIYYYEIYVSDTGEEGDYTRLIDRTTEGGYPNDRPGESADYLGAAARYIKILPTGANDEATYPNIWEIYVYGSAA